MAEKELVLIENEHLATLYEFAERGQEDLVYAAGFKDNGYDPKEVKQDLKNLKVAFKAVRKAQVLTPEYLDSLCEPSAGNRPWTVRYDYDEDVPTYHSFFSKSGAVKSIQEFFADRWGSTCLLMNDNNNDQIVYVPKRVGDKTKAVVES